MRILVLSDLHFELWRDAPKKTQKALDDLQPNLELSRPDVVVLAGDIDVGDRAVAWADRAFCDLPVIYVHGDHEAYGQKIDTLKPRLASACSATGHIYFLDKGELVLDGVRFLGAPLWTDFQLLGQDTSQEAMQSAAGGMRYYRMIRLAKAGCRCIRPLDVVQWHWSDRIWLQERIAQPFAGPTVVVTHMAPSSRSIPERYKGQLSSAAFASDLDDLASLADVWIHGHVHDSMDYSLGRARVVCNPLGYPLSGTGGRWRPENQAYDPNLIVEIGNSARSQQILVDAAGLRDALAAQWLTASQVDDQLSAQPPDGQRASDLRIKGLLLGVYVSQPAPSYRYPPWQFRPDGQPVGYLSEILAVLQGSGTFAREPGGLRRSTGWGEVEWFLSPHSLLGGEAPNQALAIAPWRVLQVAQIEFESRS